MVKRLRGISTISTIVGTFLFLTILLLPAGPAGAAGVKEGEMAPDIAAVDMAGVTRTIKEHLGKNVILLDFWSIYCVSCVQEMPQLAKFYEKYKDKAFVTYGIDLDTFSPKRVQKFIDGLDFKIPYPVVIDDKRVIANAFGVSMLPTTIIIDRQGKIRMFHVGYKPVADDELIENAIKDALK